MDNLISKLVYQQEILTKLDNRLTALEHDVKRMRLRIDERITEELEFDEKEITLCNVWAKVKLTYSPKDRATRTWFFDNVDDDEDMDAIHRMETAGLLLSDYKQMSKKAKRSSTNL